MELYWSRCKLGSTRAYWVVGILNEGMLVADGYATSLEEAEDSARQIAGPDAFQLQSYYARKWHRRKVHERRKSHPAKACGAEVRRFVYEGRDSDYDNHRYVLAYQIFKMTEKRVYVIDQSFPVEHPATKDVPILDLGPELVTFVLGRAELETKGRASASAQGWWRGPYFLDAAEAFDPRFHHRDKAASETPAEEIMEAFDVLGLTWPCTRNEFRSAYRQLSKETHPDAGGSTSDFVTINAAYEVVKTSLTKWPRSA